MRRKTQSQLQSQKQPAAEAKEMRPPVPQNSRRSRIRAKLFAPVLTATFLAALATPAQAQTESCARSDFEAVVDEAAEALRTLNSQHKPEFQDLLRTLRLKRGWSHDDFLREAAPFVQDEQIDGYNQKSQDLLGEIANLGEEGTSAANPDCGLLEKLRDRMRVLVDAQTAKWTYMFEKLQKEIDK